MDDSLRKLARSAAIGDADADLEAALAQHRAEPAAGHLPRFFLRRAAEAWIPRLEEELSLAEGASWRDMEDLDDEDQEVFGFSPELKEQAEAHGRRAIEHVRQGDASAALEEAQAALELEAEASEGTDAWYDFSELAQEMHRFAMQAAGEALHGPVATLRDLALQLQWQGAGAWIQVRGTPSGADGETEVRISGENEDVEAGYQPLVAVEEALESLAAWREHLDTEPSPDQTVALVLYLTRNHEPMPPARMRALQESSGSGT